MDQSPNAPQPAVFVDEADSVPDFPPPPEGKKPVLVVTGPTASGKSALAMALARRHQGTVINADSMQVYQGLEILTAQPPPQDREAVPHALYGFHPPEAAMSAAIWREFAVPAIRKAQAQGRLPILTGGTGFYLKALLEGLSPIPPVPELITRDTRARLEREGVAALYAALTKADPETAARMEPGDAQRIARAWSVYQATGMPLSDWQALPLSGAPKDLIFYVAVLLPDRKAIYGACDDRFMRMVDHGAIAEVRALVAQEIPLHQPAMRAVGVPEISAFLNGALDREAMIARAQQATRHYAKRQMTWFRNQLLNRPAPRCAHICYAEDAQLLESFLVRLTNNIWHVV